MAMDYETRRPVIRMQRLETLLMISSGLGWEVVIDPQQRSKPRTDLSIQPSVGEPSCFYLMMAESCFRRASRTWHPGAGTASRNRTQLPGD
jgi:hypothetical protein